MPPMGPPNRNRNQKKQKPKLNRKFVYSVLAGCIMVTMASTHYLQLKSEMAIQKNRLTSQKLEYSELKADMMRTIAKCFQV